MALQLHFHPLSSFCWKVLIALHESGLEFEPHVVDFGDDASREAFVALWPLRKMPVLHDTATGETVGETSIILEHLAARFPEAAWLIPPDPEQALRVRFLDRVFDLHVQQPMQQIVADRIRPEGVLDAVRVAQARTRLRIACDHVERDLVTGGWAVGDRFSMADCAAAPALFYADKVMPLAEAHPRCLAYLGRLQARPSFARVLAEAEPYFAMFPG